MNTSVRFKWFPHERLYEDQWHPWPIWALGWLCVIKAVLWIFSQRGFYSETVFPTIVPVKHILYLVVLLVLSQGIFNFRVWARNLLLVVCIVDLLFYLVVPEFLPAKGDGISTLIFEWGSGPMGDLIAFCLLGISWKTFGQPEKWLEAPAPKG